MRALSALFSVCILLLFALLLAPDAAAATAAAPTASAAGLALAGLGAGIVVHLSAKKHAVDGTVTTDRYKLDSDADDYATNLEAFGEAKQAEGAAPVRAQLAAAHTERDAYRATLVDEILRVEQLGHTGDEAFDLEGERAYYESLRPDVLALHYKKARAKNLSVKAQTSGEEPGDKVEAYGHVTVN